MDTDLEEHRHHYEVERRLADRLRRASRPDRLRLYADVYETLFREVPEHPQLAGKRGSAERLQLVQVRLNLLGRLLTPESTFLEVGAGDCKLSIAVASRVANVVAVDVSETIAATQDQPENFRLAISDGVNIPVPEGSIDVAFSDQLIEHLHPEDAREHLENVYRSLSAGGCYLCITPNRLCGPADVSKYFSNTAEGLHLKEYTFRELGRLFRRAGFPRVRARTSIGGLFPDALLIPILPLAALETLLEALPWRLGYRMARSSRALQSLLRVILVGYRS